MAKDPAFLFYSQDFIMGTLHFTKEQKGIYIDMLCFQHQHGGLIDKSTFEQFIGPHNIITKKFVETPDGFYNERLMKEMAKRSKKSNSLSDNAKKRWENQCNCNANACDLHMPIENENENENENERINTTKEKLYKYSIGFEKIWAKYPKPVGKKEALRHYAASVKSDQDHELMETALKNYLSSERVKKGIIQDGKTWFSNWQDWLGFTEKVCQKCGGKGQYVTERGYDVTCSCPAGNRVKTK